MAHDGSTAATYQIVMEILHETIGQVKALCSLDAELGTELDSLHTIALVPQLCFKPIVWAPDTSGTSRRPNSIHRIVRASKVTVSPDDDKVSLSLGQLTSSELQYLQIIGQNSSHHLASEQPPCILVHLTTQTYFRNNGYEKDH